MNNLIKQMIASYDCTSLVDYENALKEIIQEISLLGLWRAKFFEKASFYGGTALRIVHGLNRFSEDLDFTLIKPDNSFTLETYLKAIVDELEFYGFDVLYTHKEKAIKSNIDSAFIKANTLKHLLQITSDFNTHKDSNLKIKLEIDKDPALGFLSEAVPLFSPIPFSVKTLEISSLFSGKLHACICRSRKINIKGRDWFDFLWYIGRGASFNMSYLQEKLRQTGHIDSSQVLTLSLVKNLLRERISQIDFFQAKEDVRPFIKNKQDLEAWNLELFLAGVDRLKV